MLRLLVAPGLCRQTTSFASLGVPNSFGLHDKAAALKKKDRWAVQTEKQRQPASCSVCTSRTCHWVFFRCPRAPCVAICRAGSPRPNQRWSPEAGLENLGFRSYVHRPYITIYTSSCSSCWPDASRIAMTCAEDLEDSSGTPLRSVETDHS